jgi:hypothetical protein
LKNFVECTGVVTDFQIRLKIIYWREFSVMSVAFSYRRVTHLRDHDARDNFGIIRKHHVILYEREKVPTKSEIVSAESKIVSMKSGIVSVEFGMVLMESESVSE